MIDYEQSHFIHQTIIFIPDQLFFWYLILLLTENYFEELAVIGVIQTFHIASNDYEISDRKSFSNIFYTEACQIR